MSEVWGCPCLNCFIKLLTKLPKATDLFFEIHLCGKLAGCPLNCDIRFHTLSHLCDKLAGCPLDRSNIRFLSPPYRARNPLLFVINFVSWCLQAKERCNGLELDGRKIRVDYSITKRAHTPTPGVYMGKPTRSGYDDRGGGRYDDDDYHDRGKERERERKWERELGSTSDMIACIVCVHVCSIIVFFFLSGRSSRSSRYWAVLVFFHWTTLHHTQYVLKIVTCTSWYTYAPYIDLTIFLRKT